MTELVDRDVVVVGGQAFFAADQGIVALYAAAAELHAEADADAVALLLVGLFLVLDERRRALPDEARHIALLQDFDVELFGPQLLCERMVG